MNVDFVVYFIAISLVNIGACCSSWVKFPFFYTLRWEQLLEDSKTRKERLQHAQDQYKKVTTCLCVFFPPFCLFSCSFGRLTFHVAQECITNERYCLSFV